MKICPECEETYKDTCGFCCYCGVELEDEDEYISHREECDRNNAESDAIECRELEDKYREVDE